MKLYSLFLRTLLSFYNRKNVKVYAINYWLRVGSNFLQVQIYDYCFLITKKMFIFIFFNVFFNRLVLKITEL
ncbi:MAG: hypothetical protein EAZ85_08805 [Bacteroidetes bacterium]|nr:MAG: hypothetical protein EAZ85_08805 [Bacteroidota bacterium]TAG91749.1 MAG: hypothetical protein EAZ20_03080 [Bacteroidota bacterium]